MKLDITLYNWVIDYEPSEGTKRLRNSILPPIIEKKKHGNFEPRKTCTISCFICQVSTALLSICYGPRREKFININGAWCLPVQRIHQFQSTVFSWELFFTLFSHTFIMLIVCFLSAVQNEEQVGLAW